MRSLITSADLADRFGITEEKLHDLRRTRNWPCVRLGRFDVRFTEEQVEQIIAIQSDRTPATRGSGIGGQTARSKKRAS